MTGLQQGGASKPYDYGNYGKIAPSQAGDVYTFAVGRRSIGEDTEDAYDATVVNGKTLGEDIGIKVGNVYHYGMFRVVPKTLTIEEIKNKNSTFNFDGSTKYGLEVTVSGLAAGLPFPGFFSDSNNTDNLRFADAAGNKSFTTSSVTLSIKAIAAGTYTVTIYLPEGGNYVFDLSNEYVESAYQSIALSWTINQKELRLSWVDTDGNAVQSMPSWVYDGQSHGIVVPTQDADTGALVSWGAMSATSGASMQGGAYRSTNVLDTGDGKYTLTLSNPSIVSEQDTLSYACVRSEFVGNYLCLASYTANWTITKRTLSLSWVKISVTGSNDPVVMGAAGDSNRFMYAPGVQYGFKLTVGNIVKEERPALSASVGGTAVNAFHWSDVGATTEMSVNLLKSAQGEQYTCSLSTTSSNYQVPPSSSKTFEIYVNTAEVTLWVAYYTVGENDVFYGSFADGDTISLPYSSHKWTIKVAQVKVINPNQDVNIPGDEYIYHGLASGGTLTPSNYETSISNVESVLGGVTYLGNASTNAVKDQTFSVNLQGTNFELSTPATKNWTIEKRTVDISDLLQAYGDAGLTYNGQHMGYQVVLETKDFSQEEEELNNTQVIYTNDAGKFEFNYTVTYTLPLGVAGNKGFMYYNRGEQAFTGINAGTYVVTITGITSACATNYTLESTPTFDWTIKQRELKTEWESEPETYDGKEKLLVVKVSGLLGNPVEKAKFEISTNSPEGKPFTSVPIDSDTAVTNTSYTFKAVNAGTYTVSITGLAAIVGGQEETYNYSYAPNAGTLIIEQRELTVDFTTLGALTYNGQSQAGMTLTLEGLPESASIVLTQSVTSGVQPSSNMLNLTADGGGNASQVYSATSAGTYTVTVALGDNSNYTLTGTLTAEWTIAKRRLTTSWTNLTETYDGAVKSLVVVVAGLQNGEKAKFSMTSSTFSSATMSASTECENASYTFSAKNAGTYTVSITGLVAIVGGQENIDNYSYTPNSGTLTINKRTLTANFAALDTPTYNGKRLEGVTLTVSGAVAGETIKLTNTTAAWKNSVKGSVLDNSGLTPTAATLSLTADNTGTMSQTYSAKSAGYYTVSVALDDSMGNYTLVSKSTNFTINQRAISVSWSGTSTELTYNGALQTIATVTFSNLVAGETLALSSTAVTKYDTGTAMSGSGLTPTAALSLKANASGVVSQTFEAAKAGFYSVSLALSDMPNYTWAQGAVTSFSDRLINRAAITVIYTDTTETYDGGSHSISATVAGLMTDETATVTMTNGAFTSVGTTGSFVGNKNYVFAATNAGTYTSAMSELTAITDGSYPDKNNYSFTGDSGTLTIIKRALTLSFTPVEGLVYNGLSQVGLTLTVSNAVGGDEIRLNSTPSSGVTPISASLSLSGSGTTRTQEYKALQAGTYSVTVALGDRMSNYTLTSGSGSFSIAKKALTASWSSTSSFTYNATLQGRTLTVSGIVSSDDVKIYTTINAYTDNGKGTALENSGKSPSSASVVLTSGSAERTQEFKAGRAGYYEASVSLVDKTNYILTTNGSTEVASVSTSWSIGKATVSVSWSGSGEHEYDGADHSITATVSGIMGGDILSFAVDHNYTVCGMDGEVINGNYTFAARDVDNYSVSELSISSAKGYGYSSADNYTLNVADYAGSAMSISKRTITAVFSSGSYTYDGAAKGFTLTFSNVVSEDEISVANSAVAYVDSSKAVVLANSGLTPVDDYTLADGSSIRSKNYTAIKAGYYVVTVSLADMNNYAMESVTGTFSIAKATVNVVLTGSGSAVYDGNMHGVTATVSGIQNGELLAFGTTTSNAYEKLGFADGGVATVGNGAHLFQSKNVSANAYHVAIDSITAVSGGEYASVGNYTLVTSGNGTYTITPRPLTVNWTSGGSLTYNGTAQGIRVTVSNLVKTDQITITYSHNGTLPTEGSFTSSGNVDSMSLDFKAVNAGSYSGTLLAITADNLGSTNYTLPANSGAWSIAKRTVSIEWSHDAMSPSFSSEFLVEYSGAVRHVYATAGNLVAGDSVSLSPASFEGTDVGRYTATVSGLNNDNYQLPAQLTRSWEITPKQIRVSWATVAGTYTGNLQGALATMSLEGLSVGDSVGLVATTYAYVLDGNEQLVNSGISTASGSTLVLAATQGVQVPTYSFGGVRAGDYRIVLALAASGYDNANYVLAGTTEGTYRINRAVITIAWSDVNSATGLQYDGQAHGRVATVSGIQNNERIKLVVAGNNYANKGFVTNDTLIANGNYNFTSVNVGDYAISGLSLGSASATGNSNNSASVNVANYTLNCDASGSAFRIVKRVLSVASVGTTSFTYDGSTHTVTATAGNVVAGDSVIFLYENNSGKFAGNYTATIVGCTPSANYRIGEPGDAGYSAAAWQIDWTINARLLTVAWTSVADLVYNAGAQGISVTIGNLVQTDVVSFGFESNGTEPAGQTFSSSGNSATVTKAFRAVNAGSYTARISSVANANYSLPANSGSWSIGKKTVGFVWDYDGAGYVYAHAPHTIRVSSVSGLVDDATITVSYANHTLDRFVQGGVASTDVSVASNTASDVGTYTAVVNGISGAGSENYCLPSVAACSKEWQIVPKELTISWNTPDLTYNGLGQGATVTISGAYVGDSVGFVGAVSGTQEGGQAFAASNVRFVGNAATAGANVTYTYTFVNSIAAGAYTVEVQSMDDSYAESRNYKTAIAGMTKGYTIKKKTIVIDWQRDAIATWDDYSTVYNGKTRSVVPVAAAGSVCAGDSVSFTYQNHTGLNAQTYTVSVSAVNNPNYSLPAQTTKEWTITKRELGATWYYGEALLSASTIRYDGNEHTVRVVASNVVDGESVGFTYTNATKVHAGSYVATATIAAANSQNYAWTGGAQATTVNWSVLKRQITASDVNWGTVAFEFNNDVRQISASFKNVVGADQVNITYATGGTQEVQVGGNTYTATITPSAIAKGYYVAKIASISDENNDYELTAQHSTVWQITPKLLTVSWTTSTSVYDGTVHGIELSISGIVKNDTVSFRYETNGLLPVDDVLTYDNLGSGVLRASFGAVGVGSYSARVLSIVDNGDYTFGDLALPEGSWSITARTVQLTWSVGNDVGVYNGRAQGLQVEISGIVANELVVFALDGGNNTTATNLPNLGAGNGTYVFTAVNAGNYHAAISGITSATATAGHAYPGEVKAANYTVASSGVNNFAIAQRTLSFSWGYTAGGNAGSWIYDAAGHGVVLTVGNLLSVDSGLTLSTTQTCNAPVRSLGGESSDGTLTYRSVLYTFLATNYRAEAYTAAVSAIANNPNGNYCLPANNLSGSFRINKRVVTVTWDYTNGAVDRAWTYDGASHGVVLTIGNIMSADSLSYTVYTTGNVPQNGSSNHTAEASGSSTYSHAITFGATAYGVGYVARLDALMNDNYALPDAGLSANWTINKKEISLNWLLDGAAELSVTYDGNVHTMSAVAVGLVGSDVAPITLSGHEGVHAGTYTATAVAVGNDNYKLPQNAQGSFSINRRVITAVLGQTEVIYKGTAVVIEDLAVQFSNKVAGDAIQINHNLGTVNAINVGSYNVQITLKDTMTDYTLSNAGANLAFAVRPYVITAESLSWTHFTTDASGNNRTEIGTVTWSPSVGFASGKYHSFEAVADGVASGVTFTYRYIGFCTCGHYLEEESEHYTFDYAHQWFQMDGEHNFTGYHTYGPNHAGTYFLILSIDGADDANFELQDLSNDVYGYSNSTYFKTVDDTTYFVYPKTSTTVTAVPDGDTLCARFVINQTAGGFDVDPDATDAAISKVFDGNAYTFIPELTGGYTSADVVVYINGVAFSYDAFITNLVTREAGNVYEIIYTVAGASGSSFSCDNTDGATQLLKHTVTVNRRGIVVNNTASPAWTKVFDNTTLYEGYAIGATDANTGIVDANRVTLAAAFDNKNAGVRTITFTLSGTDRNNYYLTITGDDDAATANTVAGEITQKQIVINLSVGNKNKVYDGTVLFANYSWDKGSAVDSAPITIAAAYNSATAGENKTITFTITGSESANYCLKIGDSITSSLEGATIYRKGVGYTAGSDSKTYDGTTNVVGFGYTLSDVLAGDDILVSASYDDKNVGEGKTITYVLSGEDMANYKLGADGTEQEKVLDSVQSNVGVIRARALSFVWTDARTHAIYNKEDHSVTLTVTNLIAGDDLQLTGVPGSVVSSGYAEDGLQLGRLVYTYTQREAGTYHPSVACGNANYVVASGADYEWSIAKRTLVIDWTPDGGSWTENANYATSQDHVRFVTVYNATTRTVTATVKGQNGVAESGAIVGDDLGASISNSSARDAGTYVAAYTVSNTNYEIVEGATCTWQIEKATVSGLYLADVEVDYNGYAHEVVVTSEHGDGALSALGDLLSVSYTITPVGGVSATGNSAIHVNSVAGEVSYYIVSAVVSHQNYYDYNVPNAADPARTNATLTINPVAITGLELNNLTVAYTAAVQYLTVEGYLPADAVVNTQIGDSVAVEYSLVTANGTVETGVQNGAKHVGVYTVTAVVGEDNADYITWTKSATLTVTPASIRLANGASVAWAEGDSLSVTYDTYAHALSLNAQNGDDTYYSALDGAKLAVSYTINGAAGNSALHAGTYNVAATVSAIVDGEVSADYERINLAGTITIAKATMKSATLSDFFLKGTTYDYNATSAHLNVATSNETLLSASLATSMSIRPAGVATVSSMDEAEITTEYAYTPVGGVQKSASALLHAGTYRVTATLHHSEGSYSDYEDVVLTAQVIINAIEIENVWLNLPAATDGAHYLYNASYRSIGIAQAADEIVVS
ncbi:MAG: hypothetical protein IJX70_03665, partial [Clostridia bacterium]|nr:hypothetical protein [Clostridia bacterium]